MRQFFCLCFKKKRKKETDCTTAVNMLTYGEVNRSPAASFVEETKRLLGLGRGHVIAHVRREVNRVSHQLAQIGHSPRTAVWLRHIPDEVATLCNLDCNPPPGTKLVPWHHCTGVALHGCTPDPCQPSIQSNRLRLPATLSPHLLTCLKSKARTEETSQNRLTRERKDSMLCHDQYHMTSACSPDP